MAPSAAAIEGLHPQELTRTRPEGGVTLQVYLICSAPVCRSQASTDFFVFKRVPSTLSSTPGNFGVENHLKESAFHQDNGWRCI